MIFSPRSFLLVLMALCLSACGTRGRGSGDDDVAAPDDDDDDDASASEDPCDMDCEPQVLAEDLETTRTVHVDASWVYFSAWFGPQLQRVPRWLVDIGTWKSIPQAGMEIRDGFVFYSRYEVDDGGVERIPLCNCSGLPIILP